ARVGRLDHLINRGRLAATTGGGEAAEAQQREAGGGRNNGHLSATLARGVAATVRRRRQRLRVDGELRGRSADIEHALGGAAEVRAPDVDTAGIGGEAEGRSQLADADAGHAGAT